MLKYEDNGINKKLKLDEITIAEIRGIIKEERWLLIVHLFP